MAREGAGGVYRERMAGRLDAGRLKVMGTIEACRTAALGGHMYRCDGCGREHPLYNSCRNRHCPACQGLAANRWSEARAADILPVPYFHVVFTLPAEIAAIAFCNRGIVFDILFRTVAETLRTIVADPGRSSLTSPATPTGSPSRTAASPPSTARMSLSATASRPGRGSGSPATAP